MKTPFWSPKIWLFSIKYNQTNHFGAETDLAMDC